MNGSAPVIGDTSISAQHGLQFLPGLRLAQTWSSNPLLRSDGQEQSGFITEVSPYIQASVNQARLQGDLKFSIRNFYRTETDPGTSSVDLLRYALRANAHATAPGDRYGLAASAFIQDISFSPFGVSTNDASMVRANRRRVSGLNVSPYLTGRLGALADYRAQYTLTMTDVSGGNVLAVRANHRLTGSLSNTRRNSGWGWQVTGDAVEREYRNDFSAGSRRAAADLYYFANPDLRLGVSANYLQIDGLDIDGKDHGVSPGVSIAWAPGPRTSLNAKWIKQFFGSTGDVSIAHHTNRFTFGLSYTRGLLSGSDASLLTLNPNSLFSGGAINPKSNPALDSLLLQQMLESGDTLLEAGLTTDVAVFTRRLTASAGYAIPRGSFLLTVYQSVRDTAIRNVLADTPLPEFTGNLEQRGTQFAFTSNLNARSSINLTARVRDSKSSTTDQKSRFTSVTAGFQTRISSEATAGIGVRRSIQKGSGGARSYDENAVIGTLDMTF